MSEDIPDHLRPSSLRGWTPPPVRAPIHLIAYPDAAEARITIERGSLGLVCDACGRVTGRTCLFFADERFPADVGPEDFLSGRIPSFQGHSSCLGCGTEQARERRTARERRP